MTIIRVYTDGSYDQSKNQGGFAVVLEREDGGLEIFQRGREKHTSSQRMEMRAVWTALRTVARDEPLIIVCDCETIVKRINAMIKGTYHETDHQKDLDIWRQLESEVKKWGKSLQISWIKSQSHAGNVAAHHAAKEQAKWAQE